MKLTVPRRIGIALFAALFAAQAHAASYSFTGNLSGDDDVQLFTFTVGTSSTVTLRTWSYAGGINAAGTTISQGGFDPILALFDSAGTLLGQNDDGSSSEVAADSVTGAHYDTYLEAALAPGNYTVSVMQYSNFANGPNLSDGFPGSGTTGFEDATGDFRTSAWAFDILNVDDAVAVPPTRNNVPDGGSGIMLLGLGLCGTWLTKRFTKSA